MKFISRSEQSHHLVGYRMLAIPAHIDPTSDTFYDGVPIGNKALPVNWIEENTVHRAPSLSDYIDSTRYLLGPQSLLVRDDVRCVTHVLVPEPTTLSVCSMKDGKLLSKSIVVPHSTIRSHIFLDKHTGSFRVFSVHATPSPSLYLDGKPLSTTSASPDFPFAALDQVPVGLIQEAPPAFGILTYKCRQSGQIFVRRIQADTIEEETALSGTGITVGGADVAVLGSRVIYRINAVEANGRIVTKYAESTDQGKSVGEFRTLLPADFPIKDCVPTNCSCFVDRAGVFHIPVTMQDGASCHLLDCNIDKETATDALTTPKASLSFGALSVFPKNPPLEDAPTGNGVTDGVGIIASAVSRGDLYASNSQSGGYNYPEKALLNHDMPRIGAFKATQCYTRGDAPNTVSMDYAYIECDSTGTAIWQNLFLETWDMSLPAPQLSAVVQGEEVRLTITSDAFFYPGKTSVSFSDPATNVRALEITDARHATIRCDRVVSEGTTITFEVKTLFFFHKGEAIVSH